MSAIPYLTRAEIAALRKQYRLFWLPEVPRKLERRKAK